MKRIHYYTDPQGRTESGLSLTEVKKRIREQGGSGYTQHFDRNGSFQETTPITLGNNARTTYQAEYNTSRKYNVADKMAENTEHQTPDVQDIINKVVEQAKTESVDEEDNDRLMEILGPMMGEKGPWITERWYDWALCQIHGRLFHEYRGMHRYGRRRTAINNWKNEKKKTEENNRKETI